MLLLMIYWLREGTVNCVSKILESNNKEVVRQVIELLKLEGKLKFNFPVESFLTF